MVRMVSSAWILPKTSKQKTKRVAMKVREGGMQTVHICVDPVCLDPV